MIITEIRHGIGNQLFQYAFGRKIADKKGARLKVATDWYDGEQNPNNNRRQFHLDKIGLELEYASKKEKNYFRVPGNGFISKIRKAFRKITRGHPAPGFFYEGEMQGSPEEKVEKIANFKGDVYLLGLWLNKKYINESIKNIRNKFNVKIKNKKNQKYVDRISKSNSVSIHIRRGDRTNSKSGYQRYTYFSSYYKQALRLISRECEELTFFIFSDDIEWCKKNIDADSETFYVEGNESNPHIDLYLMSLCQYNVIAHSTFGLWAHWLNQNVDKHLIMPKTMALQKYVDGDMGFVKII